MKFATVYNATKARSFKFATFNKEPSLTQQSDERDTNINVIMDRYTKTGQLPYVATDPIWGDFTAIGDYRELVEKINTAREKFHEIPAKIREREFQNDPAAFIQFAEDPANLEKLREWGLAPPIPPKTATLNDVIEKLDAIKPKEQNSNGQNK